MSARDKWLPFRRRQTLNSNNINNLVVLEKSLTGLSLSSTDTNDHEENSEDIIRTSPFGLKQLNVPTEALVELVFVHGLGGGWRKSWSRTSSFDHFWPKSWLPQDPEFHHVRVHSFGYKSAKSEVVATISGIPDIAQSLLSALRDNAAIRQSQNAIILLGHSMGGLVIKKAFIQAHTADVYKDLAKRIKSLYFLGTPHQGSDFTRTFQSLFRRVPIVKTTENVADMDPSSRLIESLNREFPQVAQNIELRSFWETRQSAVLGSHQFVVPKHSACLNYTNEVSDSLDADHRGICKYDRPTNPNYQKVRNALSTSVERLVHDHMAEHHESDLRSLQQLRDYLDIYEPPEDDLADRLDSCQSSDTCSWFTTRPGYQKWRDTQADFDNGDDPWRNIVVIEAEPGAGKSVLAGQVISDLRALNCECIYFFFDAQSREKASLNYLLRSLAFQVALVQPCVRQAFLDLQQQGANVRGYDDKHIWRKLFVNCILQLPSPSVQFWVIDGLDECQQNIVLLQLILKLSSRLSLKILMTARPNAEIRSEISSRSNEVTKLTLSSLDTKGSIAMYVHARISHLRLRTKEEQAKVTEAILNNAEGSYLWVKLVIDNISKATGPKQIIESIEQIPKGMDHLYADILGTLHRETVQEQKPIVQAVLDWVVCANPPLSAEELEAAINLDTESAIFADRMCESLRGLVVIDHSGKVRPVHLTARAYLVRSDSNAPFAVCTLDAHSRIATLLVTYLNQRLRNLRNVSQLSLWQQKKAGLDDYALHHFSDHIRRAQVSNHELFMEVGKFFNNCGPSWIACVALGRSLNTLVKTSLNLRTWLQARLKQTSPIGELARKTTQMQQWSTDLERMVAKFGRHISESPGAIYTLIPPLVPKESVFSITRPRARELQIIGFENDRWDDRLCSIFYEGSTCTAVASGKDNFAVALKNGTVYIYDNNTMQLLKKLQHGAVVKLLKYNSIGTMLLTSGFRKLKMWTIPEAELLWEVAIRTLRLAAEFVEDDRILISISSQHELIKQDSTTGKVLEVNERRSSSVGHESGRLFRRELQYAEFSREAEMLATMQRERPIELTDIEDRYEIGVVELELSDDGDIETTEQPVTAMTFCANIDIALLAVVYREGVLAVFDRDLRLIEKRVDSKGATLLAGSPNGLRLAAASVEGIITIYDFEQLIPLHTLYTSSIENIRSLIFSGDGNRVVDIRDRQANIWAPASLVSHTREDTDSISESTLAPTVNVTSHFPRSKDGVSDITSMIPCAMTDYFLCGQDDGVVAVHSTKDAKRLKTLFQDSGRQWISTIEWKPKTRILGALCGTSTVVIHVVSTNWSNSRNLMRYTFTNPVKQFFINDTNEKLKLFIITSNATHLWVLNDTEGANGMLEESSTRDFDSTGLWLEDASGVLVHAEPHRFLKFNWDMEVLECSDRIVYGPTEEGQSPGNEKFRPESVQSFDRGAGFAQGTRPMLFLRSVSSQNTTVGSPSSSTSKTPQGRPRWVIDMSSASARNTNSNASAGTSAGLHASLLPVSHIIEHVVGIVDGGKKLIFLDKRLWVCSYELLPSNAKNPRPSLATAKEGTNQACQVYTRHFFIPDDWISSNYSNANGQLLFMHGGAKDDCLIFVKKHEVAVIKSPYAYAEVIPIG